MAVSLVAMTLLGQMLPSRAEQVLEEVLVIAQRRSENLQETPIAITALRADTLDALNISNSADFEAIVPSLSIRDAPRRFFLRGIGRATNVLGTEPGVAVYADQVYYSEPAQLTRASSLTMERIEILRGPQGTLYGRNATGGAVNVISKRPSEEFEHHVRAMTGDYDLLNWGASSAGPISDDLGYRVYAYRNKRDGYLENRGGQDIWDVDHNGLGAQLSWDVSDRLNIWLSYRGDETDDLRAGIFPGGYLITPYITDELASGITLNEGYQWDRDNPAVDDPYTVDVNDPLRTTTEDNNKYTLHGTLDLPSFTLKYIGNYSESEYDAVNGDYGYTSREDIRLVQSVMVSVETYAHELQFVSAGDSAWQWVAGLYYFHSDEYQPFGIRNLSAGNLATITTADGSERENPDLWAYFQTAELESESMAIYADVSYSFDHAWKLTTGLRYSYDEKKGEESQLIVLDPAAFGGPTGADCCGLVVQDPEVNGRQLSDDWDNVSGRAVLEYAFDDDKMAYASVASGYKAGGLRLGGIDPNPSVDEETVLSYEVGFKGTFSDVLQINAAAYFYDYEGMQVMVSRQVDGSVNVTLPQMTSVDAAEIKGVEIETQWLPTDKLSLMLNYSYIDAQYTDFCCYPDDKGDGSLQDLSGNPMIQAPKNKVFFNASYSLGPGSWGELVPSVSYSWVDERQYEVFATPATLADDYYRLDAMLTWYSPLESLRVIASGRNLTEQETWTSLERQLDGGVSGHINEPRTWALEVQYDF